MEAAKQPDGTWELSGVEPWQDTFTEVCRNLSMVRNFSFARYGDGEFYCMLGKVGRNCDKHDYSKDLGDALKWSLVSNPSYMIGIQPLTVSQPDLYRKVRGLIDGLHLDIRNADTIHNASIAGMLPRLFDAMESRHVVLVGPPHLALFATLMGFKYLLISPLNCWQEYTKTCERLEVMIRDNDIVLLCASMMSEVLISRFRDYKATFIDIGSAFDPYAGVKSRRYHNTLNI